MTPKQRGLLALAIPALGGLALIALVHVLDEPPSRRSAPVVEEATLMTARSPRDSPAEPSLSASVRLWQQPLAPAPRDEVTVMLRLRSLASTNPNLSLKLAREGNVRFPAGTGAAERGWFAARALVDLGRFDEAVAEARAMISKYPDTTFTEDVARHLLTHPMSHPTEVGASADR